MKAEIIIRQQTQVARLLRAEYEQLMLFAIEDAHFPDMGSSDLCYRSRRELAAFVRDGGRAGG